MVSLSLAHRALFRKQRIPFLAARRGCASPPEKARSQHDLRSDCPQLHADHPEIHACAAQFSLSRCHLADRSRTGIAVKLLWIDAPRLIGTALDLALGWAIAFDFGVVLSMPSPAIALLAAGGLAHTAGGIIYISKRPNFSTLLGFHELFHLFVIVGSICHYLMVMLYVL